MRKHGTSGAFDKEDAGQEREMKEAERSAPSGGGAPAEGGAAPAKKRSALKIVCAAVLALILLLGAFAAGWLGSCFSTDPRLRELEWLLETLEKEHYRDTDMDAVYEELYDAAMPDIFSTYYSPEEYARVLAESEGRNEGVGITVSNETDGVRIRAVVENSPAQNAGLRCGMFVLGYGDVGGEVLTGNSSELVAFIGERSGNFVLYASFDAADEADADTAFTLARGEYAAAYVVYRDSETSYAFRGESAALTETHEPLAGLDEETAYLRLDGFDGNCAEEFAACLSLMKERGRKHLILDLRGNGGGYLSDLQSVSAHLLRDAEESAPLVAYAQYRDGSREEYRARGNDFSAYFSADSRISVLADEHSASASECLIGALIDYGTIGYSDIYLRKEAGAVHCSTYGKGVMQSTFRSPNGGAFRLTVARIYWPDGKCIHGTGVTDEDGTVPVEAPAVCGETDDFLQQAVAMICK